MAIPAIFAFPMLRVVSNGCQRDGWMCILGAVHVRQQIHEPDGWEEIEINFPDQLLLLLWRPCQLLGDLDLL